jgi:hypothetical protein
MPSPLKVPCPSHEVKRKYVRDKRTFVQYRISLLEYDHFLRMAQELHTEGQIPQASVSCLAKCALITMFNMRMKIQKTNQELEQKAELQKNSAAQRQQECRRNTNPTLEELEKQLTISNAQIPTYEEFIKQKNKQLSGLVQ